MGLFRKIPVVVKAFQWFKNGDHPLDGDPAHEGKVVRYLRLPDVPGTTICDLCGRTMHEHGWINTLETVTLEIGQTVCPGDWIITGLEGEHYPCKPQIFLKTYEKVSGRHAK